MAGKLTIKKYKLNRGSIEVNYLEEANFCDGSTILGYRLCWYLSGLGTHTYVHDVNEDSLKKALSAISKVMDKFTSITIYEIF
mgnify:CR=1 FL=1